MLKIAEIFIKKQFNFMFYGTLAIFAHEIMWGMPVVLVWTGFGLQMNFLMSNKNQNKI